MTEERCPFSYYDRTAYCQVCDITGKACEGYVVDCTTKVPLYGPDSEDVCKDCELMYPECGVSPARCKSDKHGRL